MKTILTLVYLSLIAALAASGLDRSTVAWLVLAVAAGVSMAAALARAAFLANEPKEGQ